MSIYQISVNISGMEVDDEDAEMSPGCLFT